MDIILGFECDRLVDASEKIYDLAKYLYPEPKCDQTFRIWSVDDINCPSDIPTCDKTPKYIIDSMMKDWNRIKIGNDIIPVPDGDLIRLSYKLDKKIYSRSDAMELISIFNKFKNIYNILIPKGYENVHEIWCDSNRKEYIIKTRRHNLYYYWSGS